MSTAAVHAEATLAALAKELKQHEPITSTFHELAISSQETSLSPWQCIEEHRGCTVLLEGGPGVGKTTLARHFSNDWSTGTGLTSFKLVCRVNLSDKLIREEENIDKFAKLIGVANHAEQFRKQVELSGGSVLFILDGFDEVNANSHNAVVWKIASREIFPKSTMIILSRPVGLTRLPTSLRVAYHYHIGGFTGQGLAAYLAQKLSGNQERLNEYLEQQGLMTMCQIPLICYHVVEYFVRMQYTLPDSVTPFIRTIVFELTKTELVAKQHTMAASIQAIEDLPPDLLHKFNTLTKFALEIIISKKFYENRSEKQRFLSTFCLKNSLRSPEDLEIFGILYQVPDQNDPDHFEYKFTHNIIQGFLAAYELHRRPPLDQLEVLRTNTEEMFHNTPTLLLCYFGLIFKNSETYNPTKFMISSIVDTMVLCLNLDHESERNMSSRVLLFRCIWESEDPAFFRKMCSKYSHLMKLTIDPHELTPSLRVAIGKMAANSGLKRWKIAASSMTKKTAKVLTAVIESFCYDCKVSVEASSSALLTLYPLPPSSARPPPLTPKPAARVEFIQRLGQIYCKALREILQKILQLYSCIKLKGDSSNLSYLSFLTCKCTCSHTDTLLVLAPDIATHYIPTNAEDEESLKESEDLKHIMEEHDGEALEYVIMLRPILRKVKFKIPHTGKEFSLTISSEDCKLEIFNPTITAGISATRHIDQLPLSVEVQSHNASSIKVFPSFLLAPKKMQDSSKDALATSSGSHAGAAAAAAAAAAGVAGAPQIAPAIIGENRTTIAGGHGIQTTLATSQAGAGLVVPSTSSNLPHFTHPPGSPEQVEQAAASSSSSRPPVPPPGTLLYTAIEEMPPDRIYRLPDESVQLRKGGNGTIFAGTVKGLSLAIKKTNYRQREYKILIKLDHRNIVPLYAFMIGPPHPTHSRRFLCYHFMPKMTGDVARMLTDHPRLTMTELRRQYGEDPLKFGKIIGNLKFLLREILQGMDYLHSGSIVHRDVKSSNVLLKFFCSCDDPLTCQCDNKYQVRLADFDAAIELDSRGRLPPLSERSVVPTFCITPVGTTGFRDPACNMLVITNDVSTLRPTFSTKADIWSFGILATRIFIGKEGRGRQKDTAILLLHYYQLASAVEGRAMAGQLRVSENEIEELLHIPQLRSEMSWLANAVGFVQHCLQVDPLARATAGELLQHPFFTQAAPTPSHPH